MKFVELVAKVETLSMKEIEELVDNGIEIEDIQYILLQNDQRIKQVLLKNDKLKQYLLKSLNEYILEFFEDVKSNPAWEKHPDMVKKLGGTYLKEYFKDAVELEIINDRGRSLLSTILYLSQKNAVIKEINKEIDIVKQYLTLMKELAEKDVVNISIEEVYGYDKTFKQAFSRKIHGYSIPEAEAALKIAQREDIDITKLTALDFFVQKYEKEKANPKSRMIREDEVFSIALDYDVILRSKGIEKDGQYSPIKEMEQAIRDGQFASNNNLSKKEFAFALKMLQNPELLDSDVNQKLSEILGRADIQLNIGTREITTLLEDKETFNQIRDIFPNLQDGILKQIDTHIYSILKDISEKQRKITPEEKDKTSKYLKKYFEESLDKHADTIEMSKLVFLALDLSMPDMAYNIDGDDVPKETEDFFAVQTQESEIFSKYDSYVTKMVDKLQSEEEISLEEYKKYDEIFYQYSYRIVLDDVDNVKIIRALDKRSKELQVTSRTIENEIEKYIDGSIKGREPFKHQGFYETILQYYERKLEGDAIEINQNAAISHLISAAQKGKIPQDIATLVLDQVEERKKRSPIIMGFDENQDLDEYMQNVAEARLNFGRMPRECSEFIIKQSILQTQGINKYQGMVERAMEDFSEYELEDSKINNYYIAVLDQPFLNRRSWLGSHSWEDKTIKLSRPKVQSKGTLEALDAILHENTHAEQWAQIKSLKLNRDTYKMLKEQILIDENHGFYNTNYAYMYEEIDARKNGYVKRIQVLKRLGLSNSEITELQAGNIQENIAEYCKYYEEGKKKIVGQSLKDINTIFLEQLQAKPELLEQNPVLAIEFEKKGDTVERKSFVSILQLYEQSINQADNQQEIQRISSLYSDVLLNGGPIAEERMQEEAELLIAFKSDNSIINAYKNKVLATKFPKEMVMVSSMKSMYENHSQQERMEAQQVLKQAVQSKDKEMLTPPNGNSEGREA